MREKGRRIRGKEETIERLSREKERGGEENERKKKKKRRGEKRRLYPVGGRFVVKGGFQPERLAQGLEVGSIWRIQGVGYGVLEFLGIWRIALHSSVVI
ncbi:hypothetical protein Tco_0446388, partial [Tanacetum coccineum]